MVCPLVYWYLFHLTGSGHVSVKSGLTDHARSVYPDSSGLPSVVEMLSVYGYTDEYASPAYHSSHLVGQFRVEPVSKTLNLLI